MIDERSLRISAEIDPRGAQTGAAKTNRAQDSIAATAKKVAREQVKAAGGVVQQIKAQETAQKKLERQLDSVERKSAAYGLRGVARIRQLEQAELRRARALGATAQQIDRIGRAYEQMARKAESANKRAGGPGGGGGGFAASAGSVAGGLGIFELISRGTGLATELPGRAGRLSELGTALPVLAENAKVTTQSLTALVARLESLKFSSIESSQAVAQVAATSIPELINGLGDLAKVARDFSVISGNSTSEVLSGLVGGILKEEVEILETQGLLIKFQTGYEAFAKQVGKTTDQLTENEKAVSRLNQVLAEGAKRAGTYEAALAKSGGALKEASFQGSRALDSIARLIDPAVVRGANALAAAFEGVGAAVRVVNAQAAIFSSGQAGKLLAQGGGITGATRNQLVLRDPRVLAGLAAPGVDFAGSFQSSVTGALFPPKPAAGPRKPPQAFGGLTGVELDRIRLASTASSLSSGGSQLASSLALANRLAAQGGSSFTATAGTGSLAADASGFDDFLRELQRSNDAGGRSLKQRLEKETQLIERANQQVFDSLKSQSQDLFRAMVGGGQSFWNFFKNAGLTAMSEVFSDTTARLLYPAFGGRGAAPGAGGLLGMLGVDGGISRPGAPGGTSGFAGPVGGAASTAAMAGGGAGRFGAGGLLANPGLLGAGLAIGATQLPGKGAIAGGIKGGLAGGLGVGSAFALFPALLAAGPVGAIVGAGIGVGALIGYLAGGARKEARKKVRKTYGIEVKDGGILQQIIEIGKGFGGNLDVAVQSSTVRELVQLYAMSTGQTPGGGVTATLASAVRLRQVGGLLYQDVQFQNGRPTAAASPLPLLGVGSRTGSVNVINLDAAATEAAIGQAAMRAVAQSPQLVQSSGERAMRASSGRRQMAALQLEPFTAVGS